MQKTIVITPGEPAGIGPDLCIQHAQEKPTESVVVIADPDLIASRAKLLGVTLKLKEWVLGSEHHHTSQPGELYILPVKMQATCLPGQLNKANAGYVLETLKQATQGCLQGTFQAMVTGPVQKSIINQAGIPFTGHTEFLAEQCHQKTVVMMLITEGLRVALATTHLPLREVAEQINQKHLRQILTILHHDLCQKFGIKNPKILVCGLNPHAGEEGHLGFEEIEIIQPVIKQLKAEGMNLTGPLPADTLFTNKYLSTADAVLAMYHDQGLPVLKYKGFGNAANITLGLPIIRTSVDHGTALELAGSGKANIGSLETAISSAAMMIQHWSIGDNN